MRFVAIGLACLATLGCGGGPPTGQVTGVVTLDGQPVVGAQVTFSPRQGGFESTGVTDQSGRYVLNYVHGKTGAVVGTHQICITTERRANKDTEQAGVAESIPSGYNENSTLTAGVGRGPNKIDFALDSKAALTTDTEKPGERFH